MVSMPWFYLLAREFGLPTISSIARPDDSEQRQAARKQYTTTYLHIPSIYTDEPEISDESQL